jgi:hypothetical protein
LLPDNIDSFEKFLTDIGTKKRAKIESILHVTNLNNPKNVSINLCLIKCDSTEIRVNDFIGLLYDYILEYALSFGELHPKLNKEKLNEYFIENGARLASKAEKTYVQKSATTGEPGELFLFIALESVGFIRILNKMSLKTSNDVPFHGWDAVHVGLNQNREIIFCYGSSKLKTDFGDALKESIEDVNGFAIDPDKEQHEINLVSSYLDIERLGGYSEDLAKMLSPYYQDKSKIGKGHAMLIGYEWEKLKAISKPEDCTLDKHLCDEYTKKQMDILKKINEAIAVLPIANRDFLIWVLPVASLKVIRSKFRRKIGVIPDDETDE